MRGEHDGQAGDLISDYEVEIEVEAVVDEETSRGSAFCLDRRSPTLSPARGARKRATRRAAEPGPRDGFPPPEGRRGRRSRGEERPPHRG